MIGMLGGSKFKPVQHAADSIQRSQSSDPAVELSVSGLMAWHEPVRQCSSFNSQRASGIAILNPTQSRIPPTRGQVTRILRVILREQTISRPGRTGLE